MTQAELDDLFAQTLQGEYDGDAPWEAVRSIHRIGTRQVFEKAVQWTESIEPLERARGLDVIAQIGKPANQSSNNFPQESHHVLSRLIQSEQAARPLSSAIFALGHLGDSRAIPLIASFLTHSNANIRLSVACALGSLPDDPMRTTTLLALMEDADPEVRDWATFGIGVQTDEDSPEIREALLRRLDDKSLDAAEEALVGLAKRHDSRIMPVLLAALRQPGPTVRVLEAAYTMLGFESEPAGWSVEDYLRELPVSD